MTNEEFFCAITAIKDLNKKITDIVITMVNDNEYRPDAIPFIEDIDYGIIDPSSVFPFFWLSIDEHTEVFLSIKDIVSIKIICV